MMVGGKQLAARVAAAFFFRPMTVFLALLREQLARLLVGALVLVALFIRGPLWRWARLVVTRQRGWLRSRSD